MGSDLSIVVRPCVPFVADGSLGDSKISFTELRLVDGTTCIESDRLLLAECTPFALSSLDLRDTLCYSVLHNELQCASCKRRIGLAVDSSVRVGTRVHGADQRCAFTQGLSIFLSKLAAALLWSSSAAPADAPLAAPGAYVLFLIDLRHCLLDDVSGPWIVRDLEDLMGCVLHYHSAVSLISSARRSARESSANPSSGGGSSFGLSASERVYLYDDVTPCRLGPPALTDSGALPISDSARATFCQSVQHIFLSHNNMSVVGLRKCLRSILELSRAAGNEFRSESKESMTGRDEAGISNSVMRKGPGLWNLQSIDLQQNEESFAVQQMLNSMLHQTTVRVFVGTSGVRWRHTESDTGSVARPLTKMFDSPPTPAPLHSGEIEEPTIMGSDDGVSRKKQGGRKEKSEDNSKEPVSLSEASPGNESPKYQGRLPKSKQKVEPLTKSFVSQSSVLQKTQKGKAMSPPTATDRRLGESSKARSLASEGGPQHIVKQISSTQASKSTPPSQEHSSARKGSYGKTKKTTPRALPKHSAPPSSSAKAKPPALRSKAVASPFNALVVNADPRELDSDDPNAKPWSATNGSDEMGVPKLAFDSLQATSVSGDSMRKSFTVFLEATPHESGPMEAEPLEADLPTAYSPSPRQWDRPRRPAEGPPRGPGRAEARQSSAPPPPPSPPPEAKRKARQSSTVFAAAEGCVAAGGSRNKKSMRMGAR